MSRSLGQFVIEIEEILECEHGSVAVKEDFENIKICVGIEESAISDSMFTEEQTDHIIGALTPRITAHSLDVVDDSVDGMQLRTYMSQEGS